MPPSDTLPSRTPTNFTLDADLLEQAKALRINISQASEEGTSRLVAARLAAAWHQENQAALDSSNAYADKSGLPLARHRNS